MCIFRLVHLPHMPIPMWPFESILTYSCRYPSSAFFWLLLRRRVLVVTRFSLLELSASRGLPVADILCDPLIVTVMRCNWSMNTADVDGMTVTVLLSAE
jgi:hypothetical protein